jgi:uncharacterized protein
MSREYPDWLDPWKAAEGNRVFSGTMPISRMARLCELLVDWSGDARFEIGFDLDGQGTVRINITVDAELALQCQSSLNTFRYVVKRKSELAVIENMADESNLPDHYEPVLIEDKRLAMMDLVEDELLLAVPQVPRDPQLGEVFPNSEVQPTRQPFADLAAKMKKHAQDAKK